MLIVLQSTTHPGTTEEVVLPILEKRSGGKVGQGLLPRLCAGARRSRQRDVHDQEHAEARRRGHRGVPAPHRAPLRADRRHGAAGFEPDGRRDAKLHENTFRAVNIALANELALMCDRMGISPWR
jgi:UDP-N-acetyl-D-glucosamine dehydrogenase